MQRNMLLPALAAALLATAAVVSAADRPRGPSTRPSVVAAATAPAKPVNKNCVVESDEPIDPKVTRLYKGKLIGFCCNDCLEKFDKDPERYVKGLK